MMQRGKAVGLWMFGVVFMLCLSSSVFALEWGTNELDTEKLAVKFSNEVTRGGYKIVTTDELKGWLDKLDPRWASDMKSILIVDTMPLVDSYKKNHIPGAVQFEFPIEEMNQLDEKTKAEFEKILGPDKNRKLVFYCGFTKCGRSHNGAMWAVKLGYTNVYRYPGGIKGWLEAGNAAEKAD
jgi:thiosulfate/3-mercaptopyruvate sulfurtransferase